MLNKDLLSIILPQLSVGDLMRLRAVSKGFAVPCATEFSRRGKDIESYIWVTGFIQNTSPPTLTVQFREPVLDIVMCAQSIYVRTLFGVYCCDIFGRPQWFLKGCVDMETIPGAVALHFIGSMMIHTGTKFEYCGERLSTRAGIMFYHHDHRLLVENGTLVRKTGDFSVQVGGTRYQFNSKEVTSSEKLLDSRKLAIDEHLGGHAIVSIVNTAAIWYPGRTRVKATPTNGMRYYMYDEHIFTERSHGEYARIALSRYAGAEIDLRTGQLRVGRGRHAPAPPASDASRVPASDASRVPEPSL